MLNEYSSKLRVHVFLDPDPQLLKPDLKLKLHTNADPNLNYIRPKKDLRLDPSLDELTVP